MIKNFLLIYSLDSDCKVESCCTSTSALPFFSPPSAPSSVSARTGRPLSPPSSARSTRCGFCASPPSSSSPQSKTTSSLEPSNTSSSHWIALSHCLSWNYHFFSYSAIVNCWIFDVRKSTRVWLCILTSLALCWKGFFHLAFLSECHYSPSLPEDSYPDDCRKNDTSVQPTLFWTVKRSYSRNLENWSQLYFCSHFLSTFSRANNTLL